MFSSRPCFCTFTGPSILETKFYRNVFPLVRHHQHNVFSMLVRHHQHDVFLHTLLHSSIVTFNPPYHCHPRSFAHNKCKEWVVDFAQHVRNPCPFFTVNTNSPHETVALLQKLNHLCVAKNFIAKLCRVLMPGRVKINQQEMQVPLGLI